MKIGQIEIDKETDVENLVLSQLQTGSVWITKEDVLPRDGMIRAIAAAGDTVIGDRLVKAVAQYLNYPDPSVRAEAVAVVQEFPKRFGRDLVLSLLQESPELYRGIVSHPQLVTELSLEEALLAALAAIVDASDTEAIAFLRQAALTVSYRRPITSRLAILDTEWILNHIPELVSGVYGDSTAKGILLCLPSMVAREIFIYQLKISPIFVQEQILYALQQDSTFKRVIPDADRQKLLVLLQFKIN